MLESSINIRPACIADASFLAEGIFRAFLLPENHPRREEWMQVLCDVCSQSDTQYSYSNSLIAEDAEGNVMGIMVVIDGVNYHEQRLRMFSQLRDLFNGIFGAEWEQMEDEARPGELYVDSLAVWPNFRKKGVGTALLQQAIVRAREENLVATLAVEPHNYAKHLYTQLGFVYSRDTVIFNETYEIWSLR